MENGDRERIKQLERDRDRVASEGERKDRQIERLEERMTELVAYSREQWAGLFEREKNRDEAIRRIDANCTATRTYTDHELERLKAEEAEHRRINTTQVGIAVAALAAVASALIGALSNAGVI